MADADSVAGRREAHAKGNGDRYHDPARSNELSDAVDAAGTPGSLNPTWVEWLMGFPLEHTALPDWVTPLVPQVPELIGRAILEWEGVTL